MKKMIFLFAVLTILSCNSDDDGDSGGCVAVPTFGLEISVLNSTTSQPVGSNITVTATDGSYSEDLVFFNSAWTGATDREGTYIVTITSTEFTPFTSAAIVVGRTSDDCNVRTEEREYFISPF